MTEHIAEYPTELAMNLEALPEEVDQRELNKRGFFVLHGLTYDLATQLIERSKEPHIAPYCPNDAAERFANMEAVRAWQEKGRLNVPLLRHVGGGALTLAGEAWMGPGKPKPEKGEPEIPGAGITFALRLYSLALKQGLAPLYTKAVLDAHDALFGNNNDQWLEAWGSNGHALDSYLANGFVEVARIPSMRNGQPEDRVFMTRYEIPVGQEVSLPKSS